VFFFGKKDELMKCRDTLDTALYQIELQVYAKMKQMWSRKIYKPIPERTAAARRQLENPKLKTGNSKIGLNIFKFS
jgi:hypothetical protein